MLDFCSGEKSNSIVAYSQAGDSAEATNTQTTAQEALQSLIAAQEKELSRIARELHDDICQRLAVLSLKIEKLAKTWAAGQTQVGEQLEQLWRQCSALTGDVQALSHELHPSILDNLGLVTATKSLCRELSEQADVVVEYTSSGVPDSLPHEVSLSLFRVLPAALHNAIMYCWHCRFEVRLNGKPGEIENEVREQGAVFD